MAQKCAIREAFGEALLQLGQENNKVVVVDGDLSHPTRTSLFASRFPDRFFNIGIAEQNLVGVAAGLATTGLIPFASTFGFLFATRALDQVRTSIAYPKLNVKLAAGYCGLSNPADGATHHSIIDISVMRSLPNMTVISVSDAVQTELAIRAAAEYEGPVYLRLARSEAPVFPDKKPDFTIGKAAKLRQYGSDAVVIATGLAVSNALEALELLRSKDINATLLEIHTIKPIDSEAIVELAETTRAIVTVEEHSIIGGLGSAVAEVLSEHGSSAHLRRVGIKDTFTESGDYDGLLKRFGLTALDIVEATEQTLKNL